jgi:hypothetical protein
MWSFAQYSYQVSTTGNSALKAYLWTFGIVFLLVYILAGWRIFTKAGYDGWKILIPIYNVIITLRIVGLSGWYVLVFFIPFVGFIMEIIVAYKLAKAFGYGVGMTILEFIAGIGLLIIGWGDSKYLGPDGKGKPKASPAPVAQ